MHEAVACAFSALDARGITWALLRGVDELENPSGDIDVLVDPSRLVDAVDALGEARYRLIRFWPAHSQAFLLGPTGIMQVSTGLSFGRFYEIDVLGASGMLSRRRRVGDVWTVAPEDEFWVTLLHALLDKERIGEKHRRRLHELLEEPEVDSAPLARTLTATGLVDVTGLTRAVRASDWDAAELLGRQLRRALGHGSTRRRFAHRLSLLVSKAEESLRPLAPSVALLGTDGSGKSTVAERLRHRLPVDVSVLYMGTYGEATARGLPPIPGVRLLTRLSRLAARSALGRWHRARRRVVVYDRHPIETDNAAEGGTATDRLRRGVLRRIVPRPDVVIWLDAPPDVVMARKPEHDLARIERDREAFRALALAHHAVVVDASAPLDQVVEEVSAAVWSRFGRNSAM